MAETEQTVRHESGPAPEERRKDAEAQRVASIATAAKAGHADRGSPAAGWFRASCAHGDLQRTGQNTPGRLEGDQR